MTTKTPKIIETELLKILTQLPVSLQEQVLEFALSLHKQQKFQQWDAISDEEAVALKAEFADEDLVLSEAVLTDYLPQLQEEDNA